MRAAIWDSRHGERPLASRKCLVVTLGIAILLGQSAAGQLRWARLAPFPEPSEELYGVAANGKMYVLGGLGMRMGMVYEYDPTSDSWTKKKPMPIPTHHQSMVAYGGKIYMFGGFTLPTAQGAAGGGGGGWVPIDNAWEYDPSTDGQPTTTRSTWLAVKSQRHRWLAPSARSKCLTPQPTAGPRSLRCHCLGTASPGL
jgi:hypothetical protein